MTNFMRGQKHNPDEQGGRPSSQAFLPHREKIFLILLFTGLLILACVFYQTRRGGAAATIYVDSEEYGTYPLAVNRTITIAGEDGAENVVEIKDGYVFMKSATCPNQICVHTGKISKEGQSIVCLPNRVSVYVFGGGTADYDSMTK